MIASPTLPDLGPPTAEQATAWIAAALAEAKALRRYDDRRFPKSSDPAEIADAEAVHAHWADWVERTRRLLKLAESAAGVGQRVLWRNQLLDESARARAFLQVTPQRYARSLEQARRGETIDGRIIREEVRARRRALDAERSAFTEPAAVAERAAESSLK